MGLTAVLAILRRVPVLVWALLAVGAWGAWQRHDARTQTERRKAIEVQVATERAQAAEAAASESMRRVLAQQEVIHVAEERASAAEGRAAAERTAADRVRRAAAALAASAAAAHPAAAGSSPADRLADVAGQCAERLAAVAAVARRAIGRGRACEAAYDSLTPP